MNNNQTINIRKYETKGTIIIIKKKTNKTLIERNQKKNPMEDKKNKQKIQRSATFLPSSLPGGQF